MGPIQSSINQTLSIAGMLAGINPKIRQYQEQQAKIQQAVADVEAAERMAQYGSTEGDKGNIRVQRDIARRGEEAAGELFRVEPTEESYERYRQAAQFREDITNDPESFFDIRRGTGAPVISTAPRNKSEEATIRAQEHVRELQERRRAGRQPSIEAQHEMESQAAAEYRRRLMEDRNNG